MEDLNQAMNDILLEEEEEGELIIQEEIDVNENQYYDCNAKLCLVGKFLTEGVMNFQAMQQTLAAIWKPGGAVYIKELDANLFLFQFYHGIDFKRVIDGSPWTFNRKVLIISPMKEGINPRCISLNSIDLWVQIYDMQPGFMLEKIITEVGNRLGNFVSTCPSNFKGIWREYLRIRVTFDLSKPLKGRMKLRKSGNEWGWITFKYENVPTFCFICGIMGHSEKYYGQLFEKSESEIVKPYGVWMKAPVRRQTKMIGSKWLRNGDGVFPGRTNEDEGTQTQNPKK